ncbi:hypothetical protein [Sphingobium sp. YBL2]|uniref:hypothetical protein n=1 Tax=Sphingobium sp. (strain YBL2) TaxID=484429 RepID=UPI0009FDE381|nr:hypothetical protein [Sphingobium sp. YBL2]
MSFVGEWDQDRARSLIGCLIKETGFSASQIARRSGLAPSTLTRIYPNPTVGYSLSQQSVAKLRATFPDAFSICETDGLPLRSPASDITLKDDPALPVVSKQSGIPVYAASVHFHEESGLASLIHDARFRARSGHLLRLAVLRGRPASLAFVSPHSD